MKLNKIQYKILASSGVFVILLIIQLFINQIISKQAAQAYTQLTEEIEPHVTLLGSYKSINKELLLLITNVVLDSKNEVTLNKVKRINEVEFPYLKSRLIKMGATYEASDIRKNKIDIIVNYTPYLIDNSKKIITILSTTNDYKDLKKVEKAKSIVNDIIEPYSIKTNNEIVFLQRAYSKELNSSFAALSNRLQNNSNTILLVSIVLISIGLLFSISLSKSIVTSVKKLMAGASNIINGNYDTQINIDSNDEVGVLSDMFNNMSDALKASFTQIQNKNKELEQFVYIASHDLQEPLRTIQNFTKLFYEDAIDTLDDSGKIYLNYISQASSRMSLLIKGLLDYSRIGQKEELQKIDTNLLLKDIKKDLTVIIDAENAVIKSVDLPKVRVYPTKFRLLLQNLLTNAIKFHKEGESPIISVTAIEKKTHWKFSITDNGIGIEEKNLEKIFGIFNRLNLQTEYEGTGIGLAHCVKVLELHNGSIKAKSVFGHGTTFNFTLSKKL